MLTPDKVEFAVGTEYHGRYKVTARPAIVAQTSFSAHPGEQDATRQFAKQEAFRVLWHSLYGEIRDELQRLGDELWLADMQGSLVGSRFRNEVSSLVKLRGLLKCP